jgi:uncharacterized protein (DUF849 family)
VTAEELAQAAREAVAAGAAEIHLHPRDADGRESVAAGDVAAAVAAVRAAVPSVPVGVTTADSTGGSGFDRARQIRAWTVLPDCASVNWHERGALAMVGALLERGVAVEAGLWSPADVRQFLADDVIGSCRRILLEPMAQDPSRAVADAEQMLTDASPAGLPILLHGMDDAAWPVFELAVARRLQVRVGLEDMLDTPKGLQQGATRPPKNAELVRIAVTLARRAARRPG